MNLFKWFKDVFTPNFPKDNLVIKDTSRQTIKNWLINEIVEMADYDFTKDEEANLVDDIGMDSFDLVELLIEAEIKYDIDIPDEEAVFLKTVGQVIDYLVQGTSISNSPTPASTQVTLHEGSNPE